MNALFTPEHVAVIGASRDPESVGYGILKNLLEGGTLERATPFNGSVYPVNPNAQEILGRKCFSSILDLKKVDLAIICVPAPLVMQVLQQAAQKKTKAAIIISAGFGETGKAGHKQEEVLARLAATKGMLLLGPNCLGIINTSANLNASFAPAMPHKGSIALVSQSGALVDSIIDWSLSAKYGFSKIISYGNAAGQSLPDFLSYLDKDKETKVITCYVEGISDGKKLMGVLRDMHKPVVMLKAGKTEKGSKAVSSHTGSLAGSYDITKAALQQAGAYVAETLEEMFDVAKCLTIPKLRKPVAIITNGGGCGVLCADACEQQGIPLATLSSSVLRKLDASKKMHPSYSRANPLDIIGDARSERYGAALSVLLSDASIGGVIVIQTLQTMTQTLKDAELMIAAKKYNKPIVACFMGGKYTQAAIELLEKNGIPNYSDPFRAARAMAAILLKNAIH
ncbi:MAG: CoA-binding protein [archaeon]